MRDVTEYPFVFFPVGLNLKGRPCLVIGDDREALEKEAALREVGAEVVRIADPSTLRDEDAIEAFLVISTPQDSRLCARLRALADRHRFLLCCIDQPRFGFTAMQAVVKAGPARIAISTGGIAPKVGKALKEALQAALDARFERFLACLNAQRERNRVRFASSQAQRRSAMLAAAEGFELDVRVRYPAWFAPPLPMLVETQPAPSPAAVVEELIERGMTVATAESVTGGGLCDAIVRVPGASRCLRGGIVAYDNAVKTGLLGVEEALLRERGAVSAEVAAAMARGARERLGADVGIATTGIAGPTGATPGKPVGLVWFGLAFPTGDVDTHCMRFLGDRDEVRRRAVEHGVRLLWEALQRKLRS